MGLVGWFSPAHAISFMCTIMTFLPNGLAIARYFWNIFNLKGARDAV